jgi:hypothetical protein
MTQPRLPKDWENTHGVGIKHGSPKKETSAKKAAPAKKATKK